MTVLIVLVAWAVANWKSYEGAGGAAAQVIVAFARKRIADDTEKWAKVIKFANITAE